MKPLQLFAVVLFAGASFTGKAQDDPIVNNAPHNMVTDRSLMRAIAPFDEDVRNDILLATQYPDILDKLAGIREHASSGFQQVIRDYPQKKQNWFYELSRYPDLMHRLAVMQPKASKSELTGMLPDNSPELKDAAWKLYRHHHSDLVTVDNLNGEARQLFQDMIMLLNPEAQNAFRTLEEMPDVLSLLNDHADLTTRLGERFKNDPTGVRQDLASVHDQLESKQGSGNAAQQYAGGGYSYPAPTGDKVVNYGNPYSYWFGYPYWFGSSMWYNGLYGYGWGYRYYPYLYRRYVYYRPEVGRYPRYANPARNTRTGTSTRIVPDNRARTSTFSPRSSYQGRSYSAPSGGRSIHAGGFSSRGGFSGGRGRR
jgi:hypothetical protein